MSAAAGASAGVGSFATSTAIFRRWRLVDDALIPGTLNVGHALPTITQTIIFARLVPMDLTTVIGMIAATFLVRSLPLDAVRILVVVVVMFTAAGLIRAAPSAAAFRSARSVAASSAGRRSSP